MLVTGPAATNARTLRVDDNRRIVDIEEPAISPDGTRVAYLAVRKDVARNRYFSQLVVMTISSGATTVVRSGEDVAVPRWSPDGSLLGYLYRPAGSHVQLFVRDASGRSRQITHAANDVIDFEWRPDGTALAFAAFDAATDADYFIVGNGDYTQTANVPPVHLWLVNSSGGAARRLTSGNWTIAPTDPGGIFTSQFAWSPDGKRIAYTRVTTPFSGENEYTTIYELDVGTGATRKVTSNTAFELTPQFSPDGSALAYWYPEGGNYLAQNQLHVLRNGSETVPSLSLDRNIGGSLWMPDGKALLTCGNDGAHAVAWLIPLDGAPRKLNLGSLNFGCDSYSSSTFDAGVQGSVAHDGAIAFVATDPTHAPELYLLPSVTGTLRQLTHYNDFIPALTLGKMWQFSWAGPNNEAETGVLTDPPNVQTGRRYPIVLLIHGGPGLSSIDSFMPGSWPLAQLIASHGYVVFQPNYRGSDDHGNAFMLGIAGDTVTGPASDIMSGLEAVKRLPEADGSRVAVSGWSYGGLLTSWLVTQSHGWRAAVSGAAVNDEIEEYNLSVSNVQNRYYLEASPYVGSGMDRYLAQSPISFAQKVTTPMLIWSTTGDPVVPTTMSYSMYHALRDNNVPVKFVQFVAPTHGPSNPRNTEELTAIWLEWLDRYLK